MSNETTLAPGKALRTGMSLAGLFREFPDHSAAGAWFAERRWPTGPSCRHGHSDDVQPGAAHKTMPSRCRNKACASRFSVKTGTVMEGCTLGCRTSVTAIYRVLTPLKACVLDEAAPAPGHHP